MSTIDELIRQLKTASGESLHRAIQELGNRGVAAGDAVVPLMDVLRYHEDPEARGRALLAIGLIDPSSLDAANVVHAVGDVEQSARKAALLLTEEAARVLLTLFLEAPIGFLSRDGINTNLPEFWAHRNNNGSSGGSAR